MANYWNVQRSRSQKCENIKGCLSRMKFVLSRKNKFIEEHNLLNSVRNLESVNVIEEIQFAQCAVDAMKDYIRALEEEEKRRRLASKISIVLFVYFHHLKSLLIVVGWYNYSSNTYF